MQSPTLQFSRILCKNIRKSIKKYAQTQNKCANTCAFIFVFLSLHQKNKTNNNYNTGGNGKQRRKKMAKYTITHKCGHIEEVQLFGKMEDRERRIAYLESIECDECRKAKVNAEASAAKEVRGLANLTGSEKQVAWANTIRENAYKCLDMLAQFTNNDQAKQMVDGWKTKMDAQIDAKWWIDNRHNLPSDSHQQAAREAVRMFNEVFNK